VQRIAEELHHAPLGLLFALANAAHCRTSQWPPLSGPTRRIAPSAFSRLMRFSMALGVTLSRLAMLVMVMAGSTRMRAMTFSELFSELFTPASFPLSPAEVEAMYCGEKVNSIQKSPG
jgi:hypothetical protein